MSLYCLDGSGSSGGGNLVLINLRTVSGDVLARQPSFFTRSKMSTTEACDLPSSVSVTDDRLAETTSSSAWALLPPADSAEDSSNSVEVRSGSSESSRARLVGLGSNLKKCRDGRLSVRSHAWPPGSPPGSPAAAGLEILPARQAMIKFRRGCTTAR